MYYATEYYYSEDDIHVPLARIFFDGEQIRYVICRSEMQTDIPGLDSRDVEHHIQRIIHLPLTQSTLRAKTLPRLFSRIEPNTLEHFRAIPRNTTYFKFTDITRYEGEFHAA
jgi:hypothetical protein